jgi:uncharacterized repeat protein (TIGR03809 family)
MTHRTDVARGRDIVARWCDLAERRLEHLTELFESGRWRRYHSELAFLENIKEAKAAVETWRDLLVREAALDNSTIDMCWLGGARTALPRDDGWRERVPAFQPQPVEIPVAPPLQVASPEADRALLDEVEAEATAPALHNAPMPVLDLALIRERYPLLRNTL